MDESMQFVGRRRAGERLEELCKECGISRQTGCRIFGRHQECGLQGLPDRSRRPCRYASQLLLQVENIILRVKREHSRLGCPQDSRAPPGPPLRNFHPGQKHHPCGARSPWLGGAPRSRASSGAGHRSIRWPASP